MKAKLLMFVLALFGWASLAGAQVVIIKGEDDNEVKRVVKTDTKGQMVGVQVDGDGTNVQDVETLSDGMSLSLKYSMVGAANLLFNGATLDLWPSSATGEGMVSVANWPNSYDFSNAWNACYKKETAVSSPPSQGPTAVDSTAGGDDGDIVFTSTYVQNWPYWTVSIRNDGGGSADDLSDAIVLVSPTGEANTWESLTWTKCDTLAANNRTCSFECNGCSHSHVKVEALCAATEDTTVTVWLRLSKG